ncbi:MAG: GDYXXLXY domain-containing protein [Zoogloeaceae bacterium]|jgi:uncharacterized membrane-anchored protein|nr:GDYXXLXY domain-containing protein [Zoogloeaceae bacterium]
MNELRKSKRKTLVLLIGALILIGVNYVIYSREHLLRAGEVVFLELAPVDPRSLMQGDYMALDFSVARAIDSASKSGDDAPRDGVAVLRLDERGVGHFARLGECAALQANERCIRYQRRRRDDGWWRRDGIQLSTNAFFFQEGTGARYTEARYGEFRVAPNGVALLKSLRDTDLQLLEDAPKAPADDGADDVSSPE